MALQLTVGRVQDWPSRERLGTRLATNYSSPLCYRSLFCVQPPPTYRKNRRQGICDSPSPLFSVGRGHLYTGYSRQSSKKCCLVPRPYYSTRFRSRGLRESPMWIDQKSPGKRRTGTDSSPVVSLGTGTKQEEAHRMCISPRITLGEYFSWAGLGNWGTYLLISIPLKFLWRRPRLVLRLTYYKVLSRVTAICNFFIASLFQTSC